ncbi:MAG: AbrB/MazE/SpoVT family DNA-binding domain-containing protein [Lachnospiraceae bacterium]|nr:AbrB/MazE/SpoVT family DNA-binding domain-containing protein [Lachnospiraceae bacterium]
MDTIAEVTSLSSKGQMVLPKEIREAMSLQVGSKLLVMSDGKSILIKPVRMPDEAEFSELMDKAELWAQKVGMTEEDIDDAVKDVRMRRRAQA